MHVGGREHWQSARPTYCACDECGCKMFMKTDGGLPDGWRCTDRGDRPGNEGDPAVALGDWLLCPDCAEEWL